MIHKIRGTQDFLDLTLFNFITQTAKNVLDCNNFTEIATPILEPLELFKRSLGQTEVIEKQMFIIASDHDTEHTICLRPEATASTLRAFIEHGGHTKFSLPWKVFSIGSMFRHERPQKGRYREFHQINIEIIGTDSIWYDAYLISLLDRLFQNSFLLDNYALLINFLGCIDDRTQYKQLLYQYLKTGEDQLCNHCRQRMETNILRTLDCKQETCQKYYQMAPKITDALCKNCAIEWDQLQKTLQLLSISYTHAPTLVRGLDYYDKTVFEFVSASLGAQSAFCSGGRYSRLAKELGANQDYPSIGAAIGIERLLLLLQAVKKNIPIKEHPAIHAIIPLTREQFDLALVIADELQAHNLCIELFLDEASLKSMMRRANSIGARYAVLIGKEEQEKGNVTVKNMLTGHEEKVKQIDVIETIKLNKVG